MKNKRILAPFHPLLSLFAKETVIIVDSLLSGVYFEENVVYLAKCGVSQVQICKSLAFFTTSFIFS